jgi:aspartyl-tRNA(Asn)/glutamyl-tRNA(Gln) amidotransferase subunit A
MAFSRLLDVVLDPARSTRAAGKWFLPREMTGANRFACCYPPAAIFGPTVAAMLTEHRDKLTDYAIDFAERSLKVTKEDFLAGLDTEHRLYSRLGPLLQRYRLLLCPTIPVPSVKAGESYVKRPLVINGKPQESILHWLMTAAFNIMSRCPVLSVPSGFAATGVPTGLSIVGRTFDDVSVFRAAAAFEQARPWLDKAERRPKL